MRVHSYFNAGPRLEGAPMMIFKAFQRIPGVEAYWYDCHTPARFVPKADLHVAIDWAEDGLGFADYEEPHPNVYWASDTHINEASWKHRIEKARRCDRVFVSIWSDVEKFKDAGVTAEWLPYAAEPLCYRPFPEIERKYDIGFMGFVIHNQDRMDFLEKMFKRFPNFHVQWNKYFEDAAKEMASFKVNLNHCHVNATNMRVFESMSGGNCLLARRTADIPLLGEPPVLLFEGMDEAYSQVQWALDHPEDRDAMGKAAREWVVESHTYLHRAYRLLNLPLPPADEMAKLIETWPPADNSGDVMGVRGFT